MRAKYDLVVIGGGAAGFSAVTVAAERGANTLLISKGPLGGTCVNFGCVPTKRLLSTLAISKKSGRKYTLPDLIKDAMDLSSELREEKYESLLQSLGVEYVRGSAKFVSKGVIEVDGLQVEYDKAIIAVGAKPWRPPIPGIDRAEDRIIDNEKLFSETYNPSKIVVIGGRAQGLEIAQIMARSGVETVLIQRSRRLLPEEEPEAGIYAEQVLRDDGVIVQTGAKIEGVKANTNSVRVLFSTTNSIEVEEADYIYLATGRRPRLDGMGLERIGVRVSRRGFILVDEYLRASDNVYAAGDCIGPPMLEPVAAKEGYIAALNALEKEPRHKMDYTVVPRAVFIDPEFASVGITERELARRLGVCACRTVHLSELPKARILGYDKGFFKIVVNPRDKRIVGVHMMAPGAAEAIHEAAMALKAGLTVDDLIDTIHVFPTIAEGIKYAALAFYRDVSKMPCCLI
ncbi:MAG: mercury(II) reductase [Aeropyrum sp.]|nr:mercury(II) reductase [Aeropyrum sp.]